MAMNDNNNSNAPGHLLQLDSKRMERPPVPKKPKFLLEAGKEDIETKRNSDKLPTLSPQKICTSKLRLPSLIHVTPKIWKSVKSDDSDTDDGDVTGFIRNSTRFSNRYRKAPRLCIRQVENGCDMFGSETTTQCEDRELGTQNDEEGCSEHYDKTITKKEPVTINIKPVSSNSKKDLDMRKLCYRPSFKRDPKSPSIEHIRSMWEMRSEKKILTDFNDGEIIYEDLSEGASTTSQPETLNSVDVHGEYCTNMHESGNFEATNPNCDFHVDVCANDEKSWKCHGMFCFENHNHLLEKDCFDRSRGEAISNHNHTQKSVDNVGRQVYDAVPASPGNDVSATKEVLPPISPPFSPKGYLSMDGHITYSPDYEPMALESELEEISYQSKVVPPALVGATKSGPEYYLIDPNDVPPPPARDPPKLPSSSDIETYGNSEGAPPLPPDNLIGRRSKMFSKEAAMRIVQNLQEHQQQIAGGKKLNYVEVETGQYQCANFVRGVLPRSNYTDVVAGPQIEGTGDGETSEDSTLESKSEKSKKKKSSLFSAISSSDVANEKRNQAQEEKLDDFGKERNKKKRRSAHKLYNKLRSKTTGNKSSDSSHKVKSNENIEAAPVMESDSGVSCVSSLSTADISRFNTATTLSEASSSHSSGDSEAVQKQCIHKNHFSQQQLSGNFDSEENQSSSLKKHHRKAVTQSAHRRRSADVTSRRTSADVTSRLRSADVTSRQQETSATARTRNSKRHHRSLDPATSQSCVLEEMDRLPSFLHSMSDSNLNCLSPAQPPSSLARSPSPCREVNPDTSVIGVYQQSIGEECLSITDERSPPPLPPKDCLPSLKPGDGLPPSSTGRCSSVVGDRPRSSGQIIPSSRLIANTCTDNPVYDDVCPGALYQTADDIAADQTPPPLPPKDETLEDDEYSMADAFIPAPSPFARGQTSILLHSEPLYQEYRRRTLSQASGRIRQSALHDRAQSRKLSGVKSSAEGRSSNENSEDFGSMVSEDFGSTTMWKNIPEVLRSGHADGMTPAQIKLQQSQFEVITSQASYLRSLNILVNHFMEDEAMRSNDVLTVADRRHLFSNVQSVRQVEQQFLRELETHFWSDLKLSRVCEIVAKFAKKDFAVYVRYIQNQVYQDRVLTKLQRNNDNFITHLRRLEQSPACNKLPMMSFLLLPFQRATRLPLLISAVVNAADAAGDKATLNLAKRTHSSINKLVKRCNEGARKMQQTEQLAEIASQFDYPSSVKMFALVSQSRHLVKKGEVTMTWSVDNAKKHAKVQKLWLFLFNDVLFIARRKRLLEMGNRFEVVDWAKRNLLYVNEQAVSESAIFLVLLENQAGKRVETSLQLPSQNELERWTEALSPPTGATGESVYESWDCPQFTCVIPYTSQQPDELTLDVGNVMQVFKKTGDGWLHGERMGDGEVGWFPFSNCAEIDDEHVRTRNIKNLYKQSVNS